MNPWAGLFIVAAILCIIIAWKGTQDNVIAALLNRPYKQSTVGGAGGGVGSTATASTYSPPATTFIPVFSA